MENTKIQVLEQIKEANNVLVTVSNDPSVDQLAACIGLTLLLNKLDKHATAVFSGKVPSTLEFLQPEQTLEKNTDSLRDFIISLDKSKADKLRYKVEDKMVKIFITPYRTSLSDKDLVFSQGDFNVDLVIAIGVKEREQLDQAIISHGRILHDASVVSINTMQGGSLGTINWTDPGASSLSEMLVSIGEELKQDVYDPQIATAFLTGIVAETNRFSNEKTSSTTMAVSAKLMAAGANQQLVATKLQEPAFKPEPPKSDGVEDLHIPDELIEEKPADGSLHIEHDPGLSDPEKAQHDTPADMHDNHTREPEQPKLNDENMFAQMEDWSKKEKVIEPLPEQDKKDAPKEEPKNEIGPSHGNDGNRLVLTPPTMGSKLTASGEGEEYDTTTDPLSLPAVQTPLLSHDSGPAQSPDTPAFVQSEPKAEPQQNQTPVPDITLPVPTPPPSDNAQPPAPMTAQATNPFLPPSPTPPANEPEQSLADIERSVTSTPESAPKVETKEELPNPDEARAAIFDAINASPDPGLPPPIAALNASPALNIDHTPDAPAPAAPQPPSDFSIDSVTGEIKYPGMSQGPTDQTGAPNDPTSPPPLPPPMMPPFTPPKQ
ncbi:MAG: hypothetical protein JWL85_272 [Candidatus Saccharibacteria bacterium]|nr:hypothetical protein [Candidatus Saccharibacteria bacterium]